MAVCTYCAQFFIAIRHKLITEVSIESSPARQGGNAWPGKLPAPSPTLSNSSSYTYVPARLSRSDRNPISINTLNLS